MIQSYRDIEAYKKSYAEAIELYRLANVELEVAI